MATRKRASVDPIPGNPILTPDDIAVLLDVPVEAVAAMRRGGKGPIGRALSSRTHRYHISRVLEWVNAAQLRCMEHMQRCSRR